MGWIYKYESRAAAQEAVSGMFDSTLTLVEQVNEKEKHHWLLVKANITPPHYFIVCVEYQQDATGVWGLKVETEDMGPSFVDCPLHWLDLDLFPRAEETMTTWNELWRERVLENA